MEKLNQSLREYYQALTVSKNAKLCWDGKNYVINWFFSKELCQKLKWEVIFM